MTQITEQKASNHETQIVSSPTHTFLDTYYTGGPISEQIKRSYVNQRLPVRNQSLRAFTRSHTLSTRSAPSTLSEAPTYTTPSTKVSKAKESKNPMLSVQTDHLNTTKHIHSIPSKSTEDTTTKITLCKVRIQNNTTPHPMRSLSLPLFLPIASQFATTKKIATVDKDTTLHSPSTAASIPSKLNAGSPDKHTSYASHLYNEKSNSLSKLRNVFSKLNTIRPNNNGKETGVTEDIEKALSTLDSASLLPVLRVVSLPTDTPPVPHQQPYSPRGVYVAFLSHVAHEMQDKLQTYTMIKDGVVYHDVFSGSEATVIETNKQTSK
ncbi:hypothetical protein BDF14DRAFT_366214 [Spinellus fusiger]|nr:hypothetical protein BDF14DRAFT_366214 [Spinellus fusiger]